MHRLSRSRIPAALIVAAVACVLALSACGGSSSTGSTGSSASSLYPTGRSIPTGKVHLNMWWWGDQEAHGAKAWLAETVADYEKLHPNVSISTVLQTTEGLVPTFDTAAAAGKGPDIEYFWGGINTLEPAWKGYIRPVSDYLPASEIKHLTNIQEDTYEGKEWTMPWYVQPSFPVLYRTDILAHAGLQPPHTWTQLLNVCDTLRAKGVTPISGGLKDGFFAGWLYSMIGGQNISAAELLAAVSGQQKFDAAPQDVWWSRLNELREHKCFNSDINSLALYQGQQLWSEGKAAMTVTAGSDVRKFVESVGVNRAGVETMPTWANGPYAGKLGSTSQTLGITKTTKYPQVAASFLQFIHSQDRMNAFYRITGAIPADDRWNASQITLPQLKQLYADTRQFSAYIENFIPGELTSKAIFAQTQLLMGGNTTPQKAAEATEQVAARLRLTQPEQTANFGKWAQTYK
jgi:raffinose/stachyose/melibiose transport system substrate-binding protein